MADAMEVYVDQVSITTTPYGVTYVLGASHPAEPGKPNPRVILRMSHAHAKVMAMLTRKQMKRFEREFNFVSSVPPKVMEELSLAEEDW